MNLKKPLFSFFYYLNFNRILGLSLRSLIHFGFALLLVGLLVTQRQLWPLGILLPWFLFVWLARSAEREKYAFFEPRLAVDQRRPIDQTAWRPPEGEIPVNVVGRFSANEVTQALFFTPALLWFLPKGEIGIKATLSDGRNLYQFIPRSDLHRLQPGNYQIAAQSFPHTLQLEFASDWSQQTAVSLTAFYINPEDGESPKVRERLVISFADAESMAMTAEFLGWVFSG